MRPSLKNEEEGKEEEAGGGRGKRRKRKKEGRRERETECTKANTFSVNITTRNTLAGSHYQTFYKKEESNISMVTTKV